MATQKILWTVLPHGREAQGPLAGRLRVSIVVAPRLTPTAADEGKLGAAGWAEFHNWPRTLQQVRFALRLDGVAGTTPLEVIGKPDPALWNRLLPKSTPVEGFVFKDMSQVNLRSFPVRNVLRFVRRHYGRLATQAAGTHPTLLPWSGAHGALKDLLGELGTRTQKIDFGNVSIEVMAPGFERFFDGKDKEAVEARLRDLVFGPQSRYRAPVPGLAGQRTRATFPIRVLPPDWQDPAGGGADAALMSQFRSADEYSFYQADRFYRRRAPTAAELKTRRPDLKNVPPPPAAPVYDFHRIVASLADTPQVLRALGLVIDCVLPAANAVEQQLAAAASASGAMGLVVDWDNGHDPELDAYPRTAWQASPTRFVTAPRTAEHVDGLLRLAGASDLSLGGPNAKPEGDFDVFQVDPDGTALKTTDFLLTAQNLVGRSLKPATHGEVAYTTGNRQPVAALRSAGLGVSHHGRAAAVATTAAANALKNAAATASAAESRKIVLHVEDVHRGYRVDVWNDGRWYSLCQRVGEYRLVRHDQTLALPPDEGYVSGASTTGDGGDDHYLHETLFRWTGWSLAAPRPGRTIRAVEADDSGLQGESVEDVDAVAAKGNGLAVRFKARPGTLPRLRFGQDYRLRARVVDLAGNSLAHDDAGLGPFEQATAAVPYLRFEPVDPPALVHRHRVSEGESLERMVVRSNFDRSTAQYLKSPVFAEAVAKPASADFEYVARNERHVVPPKAAQLQCEQHGMFDAAFGAGASPGAIKAAYATAAREAATLFDATPGAQIELVTPAGVADVALTTGVPPALPSPQQPVGGRLVGGQYIVHREAQLRTPYLPDPAAGGLALRAQERGDFERIGVTQPMALGPGAVVVRAPNEELVLLVKFGRDWPDSQGLRLVLAERVGKLDDVPCDETFDDDGRPQWDAERRVLTLFVRKGHVVRLRYASFVDPRLLAHLGLPRWSDSEGARQFVQGMSLLGAHWMVTPYRPLVLVHATQQPVCTPRLQKVSVSRPPGATHADLDAAVLLHGASTGKVEVVARWHEWVDDLRQPAPRRIECHARLAEIGLPENGPNTFMLASAAAAVQPPPGNSAVTPPPRAPGNRHELGDTRFRLVRYRLEATTRFREYLPAALYEQTALVTRTGPDVLQTQALVGADDDPGAPVLFDVPGAVAAGVRVPSTAAPEVPRVVYVVPTFRWTQDVGAGQATQASTRLGNGLRVYLERPWFSSGDGELLGVVLHADGARFTDIPEAMMPFVTQWGLDPLFDSALPKSLTQTTDFPARVGSETVPLLENGNRVTVVGHRVQWDAGRRLWYCDLELDAGASYMPFVRLALVRYQPHAIAGAKVSRVVMSDFAQVLPRRRAVVQRDGAALQVSVHGPVPARGPMMFYNDSAHEGISFIPPPGSVLEAGRNRIDLVLQTRDPAIDSDLAWSDVATLASALARPPGATDEVVPPPLLFSAAAATAPAAATRVLGSGDQQTFATQLRVDAVRDLLVTERVVVRPDLFELFDPAIWQSAASLPAIGPAPARLALREFERYYTDRTVPERRGSSTYRKRVVEERLVYSAFFPLN